MAITGNPGRPFVGEDPASGFPSVGRIGDYCSWKLKKREEFTFQIGQRKIQHSLLFSCDPLMAGDGVIFLNGENLLSSFSDCQSSLLALSRFLV